MIWAGSVVAAWAFYHGDCYYVPVSHDAPTNREQEQWGRRENTRDPGRKRCQDPE